MSEVKNIPRLRFPEFQEEWKTVKFKDILLNSRLGGNYSNSEEINAFPLIKMGNLDRGRIKLDKLEYVSDIENLNPEDLIQEGDLFFNTRNTLELVGKVALWRNELSVAYYNSNLMKIDFEENRFMNYRLNSFSGIKKLRRIATGTTSVAAIYTKDLLKITLNIPSLPEQQKIADFLTSVDKRIELLEKKKTLFETYKKGVMKKIFNQEIRFKDDNGNDFPVWREMKLGNVLTEYISKTKVNNQHDVLSSTIEKIYRQSEYFNHQVASKDNTGYKVLKLNQLVFSPQNIWMGNINVNTEFEKGIVSPSYKIYDFKPGYDYMYFKDFLKQPKMLFEYTQSSEQGASVVRRNLNLKLFLSIPIKVPSLDEQIKISNFLSSIDNQIERLDTQIDKSKSWKKGLLQKMFV